MRGHHSLLLLIAIGWLLVGCTDGKNPPAGIPPGVTVSGVIEFQRVPMSAGGLNYGATSPQPAQRIRVELWRGGSVVDSTVTDALGRYRFRAQGERSGYSVVAVAEMVEFGLIQARVRRASNGVLAETVRSGTAFVTGSADLDVDLLIPSGWDGTSSYLSASRHAGAFAILDTIRKAQVLVRQGEPGAVFTYLQVAWDLDAVGSFFLPEDNLLVIGGVEEADTDEYDEHVVAHEYGHHLIDRFARDDSFGGPHSPGDLLDESVAFSEGFADAFACLVVGDPVYRDSTGADQGTVGIEFDVSAGAPDKTTISTGSLDPDGGGADTSNDQIPRAGIYNELSVAGIVWNSEAEATVGFAPVWQALVGELAATEAFTNLLPWLAGVRAADPTAIDAVAAVESVSYDSDFEDAGFVIGPRYTPLTIGAAAIGLDAANRSLQTHAEFGATLAMDLAGGDPNPGLYNWQYFRSNPANASVYTIRVVPSAGNPVISLGPNIDLDTIDVTVEGQDDVHIFDHEQGGTPIVFRVGSTNAAATFTVQLSIGNSG